MKSLGKFLCLFLITTSTLCSGQRKSIIANDYTHFQLKFKSDTIDFIVSDTSLSIKKPIFLFCQGSLPVPLFFDIPKQGVVPVALNNFDLNGMKNFYHVVVISMPKTPVVLGLSQLNKSYSYITDTTKEYSYSNDFVRADFLENYVSRANQVLRFLNNQKWVDNSQLVVAGHSQGSHVALEIAYSNDKVTQLGLFGYNPLGRIDQYIRALRKQAELKELTWEQADSLQNNVLKDYSDYFEDASDVSFSKSWVSFSKSQLNKLKSLKTPVYIAYGSNDINSDFCDLLPLYFIEQRKRNYKVLRYPNLEHNFFPIDENGQPDYQNGQWRYVMNEFIKWSRM
jgi:hypothetical protein